MGGRQGVSDSSRIKGDDECLAREVKDLTKRKQQMGHQLCIPAVNIVDHHDKSGIPWNSEQLAFHVLALRRGVFGQGWKQCFGQREHPLEDFSRVRGQFGR